MPSETVTFRKISYADFIFTTTILQYNYLTLGNYVERLIYPARSEVFRSSTKKFARFPLSDIFKII